MAVYSTIKQLDIKEARRFDAEYFKPEVISLLNKEKIKFINLG